MLNTGESPIEHMEISCLLFVDLSSGKEHCSGRCCLPQAIGEPCHAVQMFMLHRLHMAIQVKAFALFVLREYPHKVSTSRLDRSCIPKDANMDLFSKSYVVWWHTRLTFSSVGCKLCL